MRTPALEGAPYLTEHGPDLTAGTAGTHDFDGKLRGAMTAHPKTDPATGELHLFGSSPFPPHLTHHVSDAEGQLTHSADVPGATASLKHDFALTRNHVVFIEGTVTFDPAEHSGIPYGWNDAQPARIGVMPRGPALLELVGLRPRPRYRAQHPLPQPPMGRRRGRRPRRRADPR
ncbi:MULTISPECIES: carotenoid oxygenase family protein [unclassified Streptomyces]|uniref:carotenoid oxygenase family protein n=1 Tax=unclassified Streptomyces TaxID=2593676 RepID=UPI001EF97F59|nr:MULTISPECIES: carotenoid oxygenase family protein [unclassified Streptomyces]